MGFKSLIAKQVQGAMRILGQEDGLAPYGDYIETDISGTSYNTTTGEMDRADVRHENIPMVFAKFGINEMDKEIVPLTDYKLIIAALDLPVMPKEQDYVLGAEGNKDQWFEVKRLLGVPGRSVYIIHVRETEDPFQ